MQQKKDGNKAVTKKGAKAKAPSNPAPLQEGQPDLTSVAYSTIEERWSEYQLPDGTILRVRPIIIDIERNNKLIGPNGEATYQIKGSMIIDVKSKG